MVVWQGGGWVQSVGEGALNSGIQILVPFLLLDSHSFDLSQRR